MSEQAALPNWQQNAAELAAQVAARRSPFKIVLKTKDDPAFLRLWLAHHLAFMPDGAILVMDNGSTLPEVHDIYRENAARIFAFSYTGFHNNLHRYEIFPDLYEALRASCDAYLFLDTDERLYVPERDGDEVRMAVDPIRAMAALLERGGDVFPGLWLHNYLLSDRHFFINDYPDRLRDGLVWGKPMLASRRPLRGELNHNVQALEGNPDAGIGGGIVIAHMTRLDLDQRIGTNIRKLIARKVIAGPDEIWPLLERRGEPGIEGNTKLYLDEIAGLRGMLAHAPQPPSSTPRGCLTLNHAQELQFFDQDGRNQFNRFVDDAQTCWRSLNLRP
ncbi:hypothetical protein [Terrihabitans sp. B22-R8]|uniref:hypothetical protein n=1 Tax=Terrihabitans sp. B22-R8 TaxID=3425128 RepID=UPI00403C5554